MEPVSNVSDAEVPPKGSSMWVCTSMPPGITYLPVASMVRSAVMPSAADLARGEHGGDGLAVDEHVGRADAPVVEMTEPLTMRVRAMSQSFVRSP